jgi:hypothetical protein
MLPEMQVGARFYYRSMGDRRFAFGYDEPGCVRGMWEV